MAVRLRGEVRLGPEIETFSGAVLHVYLEDVSLADAAATVTANISIAGLAHQNGRASSWPFELEAGSIDQRAHYAVRAHVDRHGGGQIQPGDYVSTQSYPVLTFGNSDRVTIEVRQVR